MEKTTTTQAWFYPGDERREGCSTFHGIDTKIKWTRALMVNCYPWLLHGSRGREGDEREKKEEKKMQHIEFKL